ncbi:MAG TPA: hypothetical protein DDZ80_17370 [Cyanobacteria bacterium UBA8803]|nr:hypothetical protein [Cyanobacteria bacterium UBA9273]HBL60166.1 hypothetical protein [Cyanobacteria bacterium UBA8803]
MNNQKKLEQFVETSLWMVRFLTIVPVFFGVLSVGALFLLGSWEISLGLKAFLYLKENDPKHVIKIMSSIIGGIDLYLIGIVLMLFSFGIYELFISKIDIGRQEDQEIQILEIKSLEQLKDKILKVVVMVLVVGFFKEVMKMRIVTSLDLLYLAISILFIATSSYLLRTNHSYKEKSSSR